MKAMLASSRTTAEAERFINDPNWCMEQKLDGERCILTAKAGCVEFWNRNGQPKTGVPSAVRYLAEDIGIDFTLDGELVGGTFWAFDLLQVMTTDLRALPYQERRVLLGRLFSDVTRPDIRVVPTASSTFEKELLYKTAISEGVEGVMVKHIAGLYNEGARPRSVCKIKFVKELDAVVFRLRADAKESCDFALWHPDTNSWRPIATASLLGKPDLQVGTVATLRYLYANGTVDDARLYQPRIMRSRDDKNPEECTVSQVEFTSREILHSNAYISPEIHLHL